MIVCDDIIHSIIIIIIIVVVEGSTILVDRKYMDQLAQWIGKSKLTLTVLFKGSRDGWKNEVFHQKCDGKGATITLVQLKNGYIFGGYTAIAWNSSNWEGHSDNAAFLFSLTDGKGRAPSKHEQYQNQQNAVWCHSSCGPTFGGGHDIYLQFNNLSCSLSKLGHTYRGSPISSIPNDQYMAGSHNHWDFVDVEVLLVS
jgi:hypothetical protein